MTHGLASHDPGRVQALERCVYQRSHSSQQTDRGRRVHIVPHPHSGRVGRALDHHVTDLVLLEAIQAQFLNQPVQLVLVAGPEPRRPQVEPVRAAGRLFFRGNTVRRRRNGRDGMRPPRTSRPSISIQSLTPCCSCSRAAYKPLTLPPMMTMAVRDRSGTLAQVSAAAAPLAISTSTSILAQHSVGAVAQIWISTDTQPHRDDVAEDEAPLAGVQTPEQGEAGAGD